MRIPLLPLAFVSFLILPTLVTAAGASEKPPALVAAEQARDRSVLRTARVEFCERRSVSGDPNPRAPTVRYYTWQCARDAYVTVDHGDEEGVVMRDGDGRPRDDLPYHGPMHFLTKNDEVWLQVESSPLADIFGAPRTDSFRLHDLRRLGLDPVTLGQDIEEVCRANGLPTPQYETAVENGLHVVTAAFGPGQVRWWIDPERGWNVVRSAVLREGHETSSMQLAVAQVDGVWFPAEAEYIRRLADGRELSTTFIMLSTEFNRPEHPQELTPADIGVEPGTNLTYQDRDDVGPAIWDGQTAISPEEYAARLKEGTLKRGPTVERALARALQAEPRDGQPTSSPTGEGGGTATRPALFFAGERGKTFESQWETYTRRFIMRYRLNAEQARKAWQICRDCEALGRSSIEKRRGDFDEWQKRKDALADASAEEQKKQREALDLRRKELMAPVERIFEERLKPELDKIPTAQQRETHRETAK
jgi:hypothetical protein